MCPEQPFKQKGIHFPLKVMFIVSGLDIGGMENHLVKLVNKLDREEFVPVVCVMHKGSLFPLLMDDVRVFSDLYCWAGDIRGLSKLIKIIRAERPSIVNTLARDDAAFWGRIAALRVGVPHIIQSDHHGQYEFIKEIKRSFYHLLNRLIDPWTQVFVAVSNAQRAFHIKIGLPENRVTVIHNGVDIEKFDPTERGKLLARERLDLKPDIPVIGMVANFSPNKNHQLLIEALVHVKKAIPDFKCLLIGEGPTRAGVEKTARELGLERFILFLGARSDVQDLLPSIDIFVLTSNSESFSIAITEAMATAKPIVATDSGGPRELVVEGETGYLVKLGDPVALAEKIARLLKNPGLSRQLGLTGRDLVEKSFSLESMVRAYESLFSRLIAQDRNGLN